jgi:hypothetical protein
VRLSCQDATAELRARRQRAMSAAQSARIRKGMIRYVMLVSSAAAQHVDSNCNSSSSSSTDAAAFVFFDAGLHTSVH